MLCCRIDPTKFICSAIHSFVWGIIPPCFLGPLCYIYQLQLQISMNHNNDSILIRNTFQLQWTDDWSHIPRVPSCDVSPPGEGMRAIEGYLYPKASEGVRLKERGSYVSQLSEHSSFFYVPQVDIKRDGTYGLKCHPKHWATRIKLSCRRTAPNRNPQRSSRQPNALGHFSFSLSAPLKTFQSISMHSQTLYLEHPLITKVSR